MCFALNTSIFLQEILEIEHMAKGNRGENIIKRPAADMGVVWGCKGRG